VPTRVIDKIRDEVDAGKFDRTRPWRRAPKVEAEIALTVGDDVELMEGPFSGHAAIISAARPGQRLLLTMQLFGSWIDVEINPEHVRRV
jgi:transcription antitermination factor NusG